MTREEYVNKFKENYLNIHTSIIIAVSVEVESASIYKRCNLSEEQAFFISNNQLEIDILKELENMYPFLAFSLSNWNTLISWKLKEEN